MIAKYTYSGISGQMGWYALEVSVNRTNQLSSFKIFVTGGSMNETKISEDTILRMTSRKGYCSACDREVPLVNSRGERGVDGLDRFSEHCDKDCDPCPNSFSFVCSGK